MIIMRKALNTALLMSVSIFLLVACGTMGDGQQDSAPANVDIDISTIKNAVPRYEPRSKQGNPNSYVINGQRYYVAKSSKGYQAEGVASWYGTKFHGRKTSNGETYDMYAMTAAHKSIPLPTYMEVSNLENNKTIIVKVNDRGPFYDDRIIDLSYAAALKLGFAKNGTARVKIRALDLSSTKSARNNLDNTDKTNAYLQIGAFQQRDNAERLLVQLSSKLESKTSKKVLIKPVTLDQKELFRVRVGPFNNEQYLNAVEEILFNLGYEDSLVVLDH